jgi:predicted nucleotidyltransferase component of viral defense system
MNLKARLQEHSRLRKVKWEIIEQDYVLSWVLEAFSTLPELKNNLVFKGGTALKKMYFGEYHFSQDLDFSVQEGG